MPCPRIPSDMIAPEHRRPTGSRSPRLLGTGLAALLAAATAGGLLLAREAVLPHFDGQQSSTMARNGTAPVRRAVSLRQACRELSVRYPPPDFRLTVRKRARVLAACSGSRLLKEYPVGLGRCPVGDKSREGDGKTPEGTFYVCTRLPKSRFYRFAGLSYPDTAAARRGLQAGQIEPRAAREIEAAQRDRRLPPWNTALGGAIGIHGSGAGADWTLGCIALDNADVDELFPLLALGTPVAITP